MSQWGHEALYTFEKGKVRVDCRGRDCRFATKKLPSFAEVKDLFDEHLMKAGLRELKKKFA